MCKTNEVFEPRPTPFFLPPSSGRREWNPTPVAFSQEQGFCSCSSQSEVCVLRRGRPSAFIFLPPAIGCCSSCWGKCGQEMGSLLASPREVCLHHSWNLPFSVVLGEKKTIVSGVSSLGLILNFLIILFYFQSFGMYTHIYIHMYTYVHTYMYTHIYILLWEIYLILFSNSYWFFLMYIKFPELPSGFLILAFLRILI